jgi:CRISPR/Cas system-associated exonuclease Cas4 (RecB family)
MLKAQEGKQFREVWNEKYVMVTDTQTDLNITGKIDTVLVPFSADEPPIVLEFKSENERSFSQRNSVPYNHKCQMTIYLRSQRLPFGYVVYINKSNMELHPLKVVFSDKLFDALMQSARDIYWHLKNSKLPNKTTIKWECNFCLWKDECAENCNDALHKRLFPAKQQGGLPASQESAVQESVVDGVA